MSLDPDQTRELRGLLQSGKKIAAIKQYRDWTKSSLAGAKDFVDRCIRDGVGGGDR